MTFHSSLVSVSMMLCTQIVYILFTFCLPLLERSVSIMFAVGYGDCFAPLSCKFWAVFKSCWLFCWLFHGLVIVSSMLCTACVAKCWKQDATHEPECSHVC